MSMIESAVLVVNETLRHAHVVTLLPLSLPGITEEGNSTPSRRVPSFFRISYEAGAYLAFRHFQERNPIIVKELETLACDLQFTYETFDDELSPIVASRHLQQVVTRSDKIPVALIGAARSSVSVALGTLAGVYQIPQVSVTSTATVLDDKNLFPYFGRMIPTNAGDATAMAIYFKSIGVSHFGCLFIRDDFGTSFSKDVFLAAESHGLVVISIAFEAESTESIKEALQFLKGTNLRYFFGIWNEKTYQAVFLEGYRSGIMGNPDYFWLLGEGSLFTDPTRTLDADTEIDLARSISGTGVVQLRIKDNPDIADEMQRFQFDPGFQADFIASHVRVNLKCWAIFDFTRCRCLT
jgi:Receptor family ligand binding region